MLFEIQRKSTRASVVTFVPRYRDRRRSKLIAIQDCENRIFLQRPAGTTAPHSMCHGEHSEHAEAQAVMFLRLRIFSTKRHTF
jgi:hypothetical protein